MIFVRIKDNGGELVFITRIRHAAPINVRLTHTENAFSLPLRTTAI